MKTPAITLKNIKVHVTLSEETPCYTAIAYVDGKKLGTVSNRGHGGCDEVGFDYAEIKTIDAKIKATTDPEMFHGTEMWDTFEILCHELVWKHVDERNLRSALSRKVLFIKDGMEGVYQIKKGKHSMEALRAHIMKNGPKTVILNDLPFAEAFALYK